MLAGPVRTGMPAAGLGPGGWRKPWSDNGGSCPEARKRPGGQVALRQPSDPAAPPSSWNPARCAPSSTVPRPASPTTCSKVASADRGVPGRLDCWHFGWGCGGGHRLAVLTRGGRGVIVLPDV